MAEFADLAALRNKYQGRRCFILGNGPSLNRTDLALLRDEITIGLNRIYLKFPDMGFATTFICCANELVLKQFGTEIAAQPSTILVNASASAKLEPSPNLVFMGSDASVGFATDLSDQLWHPGATVTYCALQLAFHLGIEEVILLGVDHNFVHSGRAHKAEKSSGNDANHFDPTYFGKNVVWQYPDLAESELNYATAREVFRIHGRSIKDATVGGKLRVFERIGGYALDPADDRTPATTAPSSKKFAVAPPSAKARIYEKVLNSRHLIAARLAGLLLVALGTAITVWLGLKYPELLLMFAGALALATGGLVLAGSFATDWMSAWARRRRMKDGQILLEALSMIRTKD